MTTPSRPVAFVTGASSGIGRDIAHRLQRAGYLVYGPARGTHGGLRSGARAKPVPSM